MNQLHTSLPPGSQLELLNVRIEVGRRNDEPDADFVLTIVDHKGDVRVYVPMNPESFRTFAESLPAALSGLVVAPKPELVLAPSIRSRKH